MNASSMNAAVSIEDKKREAVTRMERLGIFDQTISQFERNGIISRSESPFGAYYWIEGEDLEEIRRFEAEYNALVYTVIRTYYVGGVVMDAYLYVSDHKEEWDHDWWDIKDEIPYVYVVNRQAPELSEFGRIQVELGPAAGLIRIM